jgi:hypothetical protein
MFSEANCQGHGTQVQFPFATAHKLIFVSKVRFSKTNNYEQAMPIKGFFQISEAYSIV